jgi:hypothetical protein
MKLKCRAGEHQPTYSGVIVRTNSKKSHRKKWRRVELHTCDICSCPIVRHPYHKHIWLACQDYKTGITVHGVGK